MQKLKKIKCFIYQKKFFRDDSDVALLGNRGAYENGKTYLSILAHNIYHITTRKEKGEQNWT